MSLFDSLFPLGLMTRESLQGLQNVQRMAGFFYASRTDQSLKSKTAVPLKQLGG